MIQLTKQSTQFAFTAIILTSLFSYFLFTWIATAQYAKIWPMAIGYGVGMFAAGYFNGVKDPIRKTRQDIGFLYHLLTYIIVNIIQFIALVLILGWYEPALEGLFVQAVAWGIGLLIHYFFSRRSIKGHSKEELFV